MTSTAVRVALRVRPLTQKEQYSNCTECISFIPNQPQILIGKDHSFTYDYVFDTNSLQQSIYETSVVPLAEKFVDGFNATILAYGQTGSGKTFSMGTALDEHTDSEQQGVVPRFIHDLFRRLDAKKQSQKVLEYQVYVSFLELYNEDFVDLLNAYSQTHNRKRSNSVSHFAPPPCEVQIREDVHGQIYWSGVREEPCSSPDELLRYLTKGSLCRTTGSTDMNSVSSRSHAIFSVVLKQKVPDSNNEDAAASAEQDQAVPTKDTGNSSSNTLVSKFHFVDLAGSERLKRTKAEGNRAREGISINSGLLALGNVISALGDESRKSVHIPYRDSKLTRLLQDSLGGNSQTLMMACVSPSDSNFLETLSTLKYANRARNIKNKVTINQEFAGSSVEVNQLRAQVARLKLELNALRATFASSGGMKSTTTSAVTATDGNVSSSDMMINNMLYNHETVGGGSTAAAKALKEEIDRLKARLRSMSDDICRITTERDSLQMERELAQHMSSEQWPNLMEQLQRRPSSASLTDPNMPISSLPIISQYQKTIQSLRSELTDTQERLAFSESIRAPLMHAMAVPPSANATPHASFRTHAAQQQQQQHSSTTSRRRGIGKKRRNLNGSTTTSRNVTFRSTKRSKVPNMPTSVNKNTSSAAVYNKQSSISSSNNNNSLEDDNEQDLQEWLKATMGSIQTSESSGLRIDAKNSISNARSQIDKALKVLDEFKIKEPESEQPEANQVEYDCDLLNDDELFIKLQSDDIQSLFGDLEEQEPQDDETCAKAPRYRMASTETMMTDDNDLAELYESNPQLHRMLNQIQSDIQVNEDLVLQLEKTEVEYSQMRKKFEKKLFSLRDEILSLRQQQQQQKKEALASTTTTATTTTTTTAAAYNMNSIRHAYEAKMKNLMNQLSELRRKYSQTSSTMQSSRNQNENMLRALRVNVESLKVEKRRMIKRMKDEAERVKEKLHNHEREIQQLRRKQTKDNEIKKKLEREVKQMQLVIGKKTDESVVTAEKLKSLVKILKKAVREGGVLDEKLLASCGSLLDIGSALVQSSRVGRMSRNRRNNSNHQRRRQQEHQGVPAEVRAGKKKALLDNALYQLIQGKQAVEEMKQLLAKRNDLSQRKIEYQSERELLVLDQDTKDLSSIDNAFRQVIDENIETVEAEISYINARIHAIHNDAAAEIMQEDENDEEIIDIGSVVSHKKRRVTFQEELEEEHEEDNWHDMDALEERYSLPASAGPEQSLEMISKIFKSLADDEAKYVMETVIDDIVLLRMEEHNNKMSIQQLEKTTQDLRRTLIVMKKAAIETTIENEKKLKRLSLQQAGGGAGSSHASGSGSSRRTSMSRECSSSKMSCRSSPTNEDSSDADSAIDLHNEDQYQHVETMFEKIYTDGLSGKMPTYDYGVAMAEATAPVLMAENELSPYLRPRPVTALAGSKMISADKHGVPVQAPMKPSTSPLVSRRRDSMSSPEQFLLQFLQTPKDVRPAPPSSPLMKPAEFARYQQDRESSTNSLARNNSRNFSAVPRRSSLQSDNGSYCSLYSSNHGYSQQMIRASSGGGVGGGKLASNNEPFHNHAPPPPQPATTILNRRRAFSFQQPPSPTPQAAPTSTVRRRSLLRELTNNEPDQTLVHSTNKHHFDYSNHGTALIPTFSSHNHSAANISSNARPHSVLAFHAAAAASTPRPVSSKAAVYPSARRESPNNSYELRKSAVANNVFDRLSSGHTHASQAKKRLGGYQRYSSSSIDDLRMQWANELSERNED
ncbi:hypothetical protein [Parasitella parasitica]|uniref:Kinesin motor domain-containing protein n=1 Tax=Parasitella parasitica TaxID=35722 RepID=A0A0B7NE53_9FUNG|nr:hypothetical protein [Parasitella parasitica]